MHSRRRAVLRPGIVLPNMVPEPPAMPFTRSAFAGLLEPLDRRVIARAVREHDGDHGVGNGDNAWTCERHLKTLLFGQFAGLKSLREIVEGLGAQSAAFYHLNLRAPCRSTLSDANAVAVAGGGVWRDCEGADTGCRGGVAPGGRGLDSATRFLAHPAPGRGLCLGPGQCPHPRSEAPSAA